MRESIDRGGAFNVGASGLHGWANARGGFWRSGTHFGGDDLISAAAAAAAVTSPQYNNIYIRGARNTYRRRIQYGCGAKAKKKCVGSARGRSARRWLNALAGLMELRLWRTGRPDKLTSTPSTPRCMWTAAAANFHNTPSCENVCRIIMLIFIKRHSLFENRLT